jgi:hypothetical protein
VVLVAYRPGFREQPWQVLGALGCLAGFTLWTFLSITWADVQGDAWDGGNRTLLYLTVYALFALWPWRPAAAAVLLGIYVVATTGVVGGFFVRSATADNPAGFFTDGRFADPAGYINANAALVLAAFWPALFLASRREVPWPLRGVMLGCAGVLLQLGLLPQSRGSLFAFPIVAVLYVAFVPGRARSLLVALPVAIVVAASLDPILDVYTVGESAPQFGGALDDAARTIVRTFIVLALVGAAFGLADRFLRIPERTAQPLRQTVGGLGAAAAVTAAIALVLVYGNPVTRATDAWEEFKAGQTVDFGESHFTGGLGSNRYDFWRVAVGEFKDSPLTGIGADNFAVDYVRDRGRTGEEPLYPHSLELMVLSQTGMVGSVLFAGFLVCALAAAWRARLLSGRFGRGLAAVAVIAFAYFFVHGSGDWFWEFPALGAPAFAWLGLAAGLARGADPPPEVAPRRRVLWSAGGTIVVLLAAAAALSYVLPWLAAREVDLAARSWETEPAVAFERLDRARGLNPLSDRADLIAGAIAGRIGDLDRMRAAYSAALERNPRNWYAHLEIAILDANAGKRAAALRRLATARALNPFEPTIADVRRRVEEGQRVSLEVVSRTFLQRVEERTS